MKYEKYLLIKLAEEASEVAQAAIKCSLFGYESKDPRETDGDDNLVKMLKELLDMSAVLIEIGEIRADINNPFDFNEEEYILSKRKKLNHYYNVISNQTS